jgi:hypothetical protein
MMESPYVASVMLAVSGSIPAWATRRIASIQSSAARSDEHACDLDFLRLVTGSIQRTRAR